MNDSLLDVIHDTAKDIHKSGVMDTTTMREFDALCLPQVNHYAPGQIRSIREKNKASQAVFAAYLNISVSTIQKWERGDKKPNGPSLKLLNMVARKGLDVLA